jgi:chromosome segregation ATPase
MGIEKKVDRLRQRVVQAEAKSEEALKIAEQSMGQAAEAIEACNRFRKAVAELLEHSRSNTEAIVEHIAQLDAEREEVIGEYRAGLEETQKGFNGQVRELEMRLSNLGGRVEPSDDKVGE